MRRSIFNISMVLMLLGILSLEAVEIDHDTANQSVEIRFQTLKGRAYLVEQSSSLDELQHTETIQGVDGISSIVQPVFGSSHFWKIQPYEAFNTESLREWQRFVVGNKDSYHVGLIGDSFTHTNYRYILPLATKLQAEYGSLGCGYLGFGYPSGWLAGKNGSINSAWMEAFVDTSEWTSTYGYGYGPDACHLTSKGDTSNISIWLKQQYDRVRIYYVTNPESTGFRYRVKDYTDWEVVDTREVKRSMMVEISDLPAQRYTEIQIEALSAEIHLLGASGLRDGAGVVASKLARSGGMANMFAANEYAVASFGLLGLDMGVILFGINEQFNGVSGSHFRASIEALVLALRSVNPQMDIVLVLPNYTKFEDEQSSGVSLDVYRTELLSVAEAMDCSFFDMTQVFGPANQLQNLIDRGLIHSDRIHPTTTKEGQLTGGEVMASTLFEELFK